MLTVLTLALELNADRRLGIELLIMLSSLIFVLEPNLWLGWFYRPSWLVWSSEEAGNADVRMRTAVPLRWTLPNFIQEVSFWLGWHRADLRTGTALLIRLALSAFVLELRNVLICSYMFIFIRRHRASIFWIVLKCERKRCFHFLIFSLIMTWENAGISSILIFVWGQSVCTSKPYFWTDKMHLFLKQNARIL